MTHVWQPLAGGFTNPWGGLPAMRGFPVAPLGDIPAMRGFPVAPIGEPIAGQVFGPRDSRAFLLLGGAANAILGELAIRAGDNGQAVTIGKAATTLLTGMSGATVTATNLIPAGSLVLGVTCRVTTLITGASSFDVGDGTTVDNWGNNIALTSGTTTSIADFTAASPDFYTASTSVVLTAVTSNFTAGAVRVTVHYITLTPPAS